jgi:hypothetical protein
LLLQACSTLLLQLQQQLLLLPTQLWRLQRACSVTLLHQRRQQQQLQPEVPQ